MKQVTEFEIINHGVEWPDNFQGCGVSMTKFEDVATGIGGSTREALEDALGYLAQLGWDVDTPELGQAVEDADDTDLAADCFADYLELNGIAIDDYYGSDEEIPCVYVSVRVK